MRGSAESAASRRGAGRRSVFWLLVLLLTLALGFAFGYAYGVFSGFVVDPGQ
ncbi:MAG: hypothetical protein HQL59_07765 [Magnetococcales bacterium]|nr:hypothetical protein [Magnetococcales bacterium]